MVGVLALGQEGPVGHCLEAGAALGFPDGGLQKFPVGRDLRCGPGSKPRLEALGEHGLFVLSEVGPISGVVGLEGGQPTLGLFRIQVELPLTADGRGESRQQTVIISGGDGIELVVMAPGTPHGHTEHGGGRGGQHVVHCVVAGPLHLVGGDLRGEHPGSKKPGGHECEWVPWLELVTGQLPLHELVVGHIGIQSFDDKVSEVMSSRSVVVVFEARAFGESCHIQPMPRPAFAVLRLGQQRVDRPFPRSRGRI